VNLTKAVPHNCQTENWLFDENSIVKLGSLHLDEVLKLHPTIKSEFIFGNDKNELTANEIKKLKYSLEIAEVTRIKLDTSIKGDGRNHYKLQFRYNNTDYSLALTDPKLRQESLDKFPFGKAMLVISIPSHPYGENDLYYKFIAKVFIHL
jgi:hypothetical protein